MVETVDIVGAALVRDNRVLLGRRNASKRIAASCWDLIGGHVEPGETEQDTLVREVAEEIGVRPTEAEAWARWTFETGAVFSVFRVTAWSGGEPRLLGDEHTELAWFTAGAACALPDLAAPEYQAFIRSLWP